MKLDKYLSKNRVKHSELVSKKAVELARVYGLDVEVCEIAGLLHDIGKEVKIPPGEDVVTYHCIAGVAIAKNDFKITDMRILNAILFHTTGFKDMDDYAKVIYIADKTEESRDYSDVTYLRSLTGKPLDDIVLAIIESSRKYHTSLHPWTIELLKSWGINE